MVDVADLTRALRGAVGRGELSAWFQAQFDLATSRLVGAEALCRWHHPTWGPVPPSDFIPVAEEDGTIADIGRFMAEEALSAMAEWEIDISVNVSPAQLEGSEFTSWLERMLLRLRRPARRLVVEITEGRHLDDAPALVGRLDRLRRLGVDVSIDDFGSGQASLTQARRLHASELKIDRSLVEDESTAGVRLLADAVMVAHDARLRVVAEGVETPEQLEKVRRLGCDRAQGYLLSRPVSRVDMARLVAAG